MLLGDTNDPCGVAAGLQLQCYKGASSLGVVRQLDRPGIVVLRDANGKPYHVLLSVLDGDIATLRRGTASVQVPLSSLGAVWRGEFYTLWRTPPSYAGPAGATAPLPAQVSAFQVAQGLSPDGLPGPLTVMHLNRASGIDEPRLLPGTRR